MEASPPRLSKLTIGAIVVAVMYLAGGVLVPLVLAAILGFVLAIPVHALQRLGLSRPIAVFIVVVTTFAAIFSLGQLVADGVSDLSDNLPKYEAAIRVKVEGLADEQGRRSGALQRAKDVLDTLSREIAASRRKNAIDFEQNLNAIDHRPSAEWPIPWLGFPASSLAPLVSSLLGPLTSTMLSFVFVVFILIQSEELRNRFIRLAGATDIPLTTAALDDAASRLSRLFLTQCIINSIYSALIGLGLWLIGVPASFIWGALSGVLRFIPYVGPILGLIFPLVLALAVGDGWSMALWTIALYAGLEGVTGQVFEPLFEGRSTGLTPVAIVVAATFWTWIWGPIGLVLSTPLTIILVVLGRHFKAFETFAILLGDSPALSDPEALYQKLLGRHAVEAITQAKAIAMERSLSDYYDTVIRPTLLLARADSERGAIGSEAQDIFQNNMKHLSAAIAHGKWGVAGSKPRKGETPGRSLPIVSRHDPSHPNKQVSVLTFGPANPLDAAAAAVFSALLKAHGLENELESLHALKARGTDRGMSPISNCICLSSLDCDDEVALADTVRFIREHAPASRLVLGLWGAKDASAIEKFATAIHPESVFVNFHDAAYAILNDATASSVAIGERR